MYAEEERYIEYAEDRVLHMSKEQRKRHAFEEAENG